MYNGPLLRRGGRVAECTGLENRRRVKPSASSNLASSAILLLLNQWFKYFKLVFSLYRAIIFLQKNLSFLKLRLQIVGISYHLRRQAW